MLTDKDQNKKKYSLICTRCGISHKPENYNRKLCKDCLKAEKNYKESLKVWKNRRVLKKTKVHPDLEENLKGLNTIIKK